MSCSSTPMMITSSVSLTNTLATTTSLAPFTATMSEKQSHVTQDTEMRSVHNNPMDIAGVPQSWASTSHATTLPPASTNNNQTTLRPQRTATPVTRLSLLPPSST